MALSNGTEKAMLLVVFKLKDGVTREEWMAALEPAMRWTLDEPGYVSTDLYHAPESDIWITVDVWASKHDAEVHAGKAPVAEANAAMFGLIEESSVQVHIADHTRSGPQSAGNAMGPIVELISFKLNDGVTDEQWAEALDASLVWTAEQPGYVSCDCYHDAATDEHIDVVRWESREHSNVHMEKVVVDPANQPMFALVDEATTQVHVAERVTGSVARAHA